MLQPITWHTSRLPCKDVLLIPLETQRITLPLSVQRGWPRDYATMSRIARPRTPPIATVIGAEDDLECLRGDVGDSSRLPGTWVVERCRSSWSSSQKMMVIVRPLPLDLAVGGVGWSRCARRWCEVLVFVLVDLVDLTCICIAKYGEDVLAKGKRKRDRCGVL
jgi:hypothetical protein